MKATDKLRVWWNKREADMMCWHPLGLQTQCDAAYLLDAIKPIIESLERRGYDKRTLRISIEPRAGEQRFASTRGGTTEGPSDG